jgi:hypothetical protein
MEMHYTTLLETLAGYNVPRTVVTVEQISRGPNRKPDYRWAREAVEHENR